MLDHVSLGVSNLEWSRKFYDAALAPLGVSRILDFDLESVGSDYGQMAAPLGVEFTITEEKSVAPKPGVHICFRAPSRQAVDLFFKYAIAAGGRSNGEPGLRNYHQDYYAAFVMDQDGNNIEAVCHLPEPKRIDS